VSLVDTYTAQATAHDVKKGLANHKVSGRRHNNRSANLGLKNLESSDTALLVFGNGDGGGGPLSKMLENVCISIFFTLFCTAHFIPGE
jgi:alpha-mannosidase